MADAADPPNDVASRPDDSLRHGAVVRDLKAQGRGLLLLLALQVAQSLSAGQQQLLTLARAFIAQPAVLILDEATSSVDTRTERLVQQAMAQLRAGRTSFVIAHRLSTILDADFIAYMEDGNVVEQGSHAALMQARGRYWALYESQFSSDPLPA